ncbi:hypothetical protein LX32DRAFT_657640 [Colletotrichum zoysiae]|uniref:NACHT domain-containing protein n=1 Tax=Colletotrichum zoysiae TaxID=1216348 RepID=A0AAD9H5K0_9PEZI|nr:hypothetical protein LX32DRAFT_657640 [Colletotrichum zoysiae]
MAELAAIGLASNLIQFTEVGIKLFALARETYRTGTTTKHDALEGEIMSNISINLNKENSTYKRLWVSLEQAVRTLSHEKKTLGFEQRLKKLKSDLQFHIVAVSMKKQEETRAMIKRLQYQNDRLETRTTKTLDGMLERIETLACRLEENESEGFHANSKKFMSAVEQFHQAKAIVERQHHILESLRFDKLRARESAIPENHNKTFNWIFQEQVTKFPEWLRSKERIFWVRGKAGSGKSTLMKFLVSQEGMRNLTAKLQAWGGHSRVVTTSHYFWHAGNSMQKSQRGLLQTLLFGILKELPSHIETVCKSRWETPVHMLRDSWELHELMASFDALAYNHNEDLPVKFCFLIDGLDEYTGGAERYHGQFEDLLTTLYTLASLPSVKLCVSSRPWPAFNESLGPRVGDWHLQVEDLTRDDIERVVRERMEASPNYRRLLDQDHRCSEIPSEIVQRAQGVFLWVHLIVKSLTDGMANRDGYNLLRKRLNEIPDDLESYFRQMVEQREKVYGDYTIRLFKTMIESAQALPLLAFRFLDKEYEENSENYALEMGIGSFSKKNAGAMLADLRRRVNVRGGDLLYISPIEDDFLRFQVDFLHRTVRDFFIETGVMDEIKVSKEARKFNALPSLCNIMLAMSKTVPYPDDILQVDFNQVFRYADGLMHYARRVEDKYTHGSEDSAVLSGGHKSVLEMTFRCLDALDDTNIRRLDREGVHWTNRKDAPRGHFKESNKKSFLAAAIQARLCLYVEHKIAESPGQIKSKGGRPLLDYALRPTMITTIEMTGQEGPVSPLVQLLLRRGDDPNNRLRAYGGRTPWELFLDVCHRHGTRGDKHSVQASDVMISMVEMILHGADTEVTIETEGGDRVGILEIARGLDLSRNQIGKIQDSLLDAERKQSEKQQSGLLGMFKGLMTYYIWQNDAV